MRIRPTEFRFVATVRNMTPEEIAEFKRAWEAKGIRGEMRFIPHRLSLWQRFKRAVREARVGLRGEQGGEG